MNQGRIIKPDIDHPKFGLPRVGIIKVGGIENNRPISYDYFVANGKYAGLFALEYGEKPKSIQIVFPHNNPEFVCNERYEYRTNEGELLAVGNGQVFKCWNGQEYQELSIEQYPNLMKQIAAKYPNIKAENENNGWDIALTLNFIIPKIKSVAGYWQFTTKGASSSIPAIRDAFDTILESQGYCAGILFDLNVEFAASQKPGTKSNFPVITLVANTGKNADNN